MILLRQTCSHKRQNRSGRRNKQRNTLTSCLTPEQGVTLLVVVMMMMMMMMSVVMVQAYMTTTTTTATTRRTTPTTPAAATTTTAAPFQTNNQVRFSFAPLLLHAKRSSSSSSNSNSNAGGLSQQSRREMEIRRKIAALKKQGRLPKNKNRNSMMMDQDEDDDNEYDNNKDDYYANKVQQKLGKAKSKLLGFSSNTSSGDDDEDDTEMMSQPPPVTDSSTNDRMPRIGSLPVQAKEEEEKDIISTSSWPGSSSTKQQRIRIDPSLFDSNDDNDDDDDNELSEDDLIELVAQKMTEEKDRRREEERQQLKEQARERLAQLEQERVDAAAAAAAATNAQQQMLTTGVGGSYYQTNETAKEDLYKPKSGSWGAFPRPRDISRAYGGGRRVGPGYSNESAERIASSTQATREALQRYREKVGIEVQSEKDHAADIEQALAIAGYAMQRGVYSSAVSALEVVTKYCSTNSKVGGKVFLELAMAYEAVGRTEEALEVYRTLSTCRIEEIKYNAKRLLYGLEAMQFMQKNVGSKEFSRKKAKNTFIDTTGLANFASNFDDVYNTAWIDLDSGAYKRLTESVVRSSREARQILLQATGAGEVGRLRIVQALRSLSRNFDDALEKEIIEGKPEMEEESVAVMNGKPILGKRRTMREENRPRAGLAALDEFTLTSADQMKENLSGEWRLQLLADKTGDGVKFYNTTLSWQNIDMGELSFTSEGSSGFLNVQQSGVVTFNDERRILRRQSVQIGGNGAVFAGLLGATRSGAPGAIVSPQQVMSVDSVLLITRKVPSRREKSTSRENDKDYFAVWRRVEPGALSAIPGVTTSREMNLQ